MSAAPDTKPYYYVPQPSHWPITGSVALLLMGMGAAFWMNSMTAGPWLLGAGFIVLVTMMFGWFGSVISESQSDKYNRMVDVSFRWAMSWFIFSEVMFFAAFFGALYWARAYSLPMLGDIDHQLLWPDFKAVWPSSAPGFTASPAGVVDPFTTMGPWPIPTLNTAILLTSGGTITIAHHALIANQRAKTIFWMWVTVALGITFLGFQAYEYVHAYQELNLKLSSGIYGSTFFMLTGFHGFHVFVGMLMLTFITLRLMKGHFTPQKHFGFEGAAWYWHFVDVVWLGLYFLVYWL
jgi:cytochrome c oxidase subunit 3